MLDACGNVMAFDFYCLLNLEMMVYEIVVAFF